MSAPTNWQQLHSTSCPQPTQTFYINVKCIPPAIPAQGTGILAPFTSDTATSHHHKQHFPRLAGPLQPATGTCTLPLCRQCPPPSAASSMPRAADAVRIDHALAAPAAQWPCRPAAAGAGAMRATAKHARRLDVNHVHLAPNPALRDMPNGASATRQGRAPSHLLQAVPGARSGH